MIDVITPVKVFLKILILITLTVTISTVIIIILMIVFRPKAVTVLHTNMRSLVKNFYKLEELIVEPKKIPDIIAITETWLGNSKLNKVSLQGYQFRDGNSINADADKMGQARGVGLYTKNSLTFTDLKLELKIDCCNVKSLWTELNLAKNKQCILGVICRHPKQNLNDFIQEILRCLDNLN